MKKLRNLFLAVLVLIVSVFTINVSAEEATQIPDEKKPGTIVIENAKNEKTYELYKIFDLKYSNSNYAYTVDSNWENFFFGTDAPGKDFIVENNEANSTLNPIAYNGTTYRMDITESNKVELAKLALKYARDLTAYSSKTAKADGQLVFDDLDLGYYLVYPVGATEKNEYSHGSIAALTSTVPSINVNVKAGYPTLEKNVTNGFTFDVGQLANFEIKGTVPDTNGFETYTYTITDTWTSGLAYDASKVNFVVTIDGEEVDYAPTFSTSGFTLTIPVMNHQNKVGKEIKVTYSLVVTDAAIMNSDTKNTAYLTYSNNPKTDDEGTTVPSTEYVYSSKIVVTKVDGKNNEVKLPGAKFILKKGDLFYKVDENGNVTWETTQNLATELTTNANGVVEFTGLADGTYSLIETAAPEGYNLVTEATPVTVTPNNDDDDDKHVIPVAATPIVQNFSGAQLPSTGGLGTKLFIVIGSLLAIISGVVLVTNKRIAKEGI